MTTFDWLVSRFTFKCLTITNRSEMALFSTYIDYICDLIREIRTVNLKKENKHCAFSEEDDFD